MFWVAGRRLRFTGWAFSASLINPFDTSPKSLAEFNKFEEARQKSGLAAPEEDRPPHVVGLDVVGKIEIIADRLLKKGYATRAVEKIIGGNFARIFHDIWTTQS